MADRRPLIKVSVRVLYRAEVLSCELLVSFIFAYKP